MTLRSKNIAAIAVAVLTALTSCLGKEEEVTLYSDAAITSVTLGTMTRYTTYTRPSTGVADSVVKTTYSGSSYKMNIDQVNGTIYNNRALPAGTDLAHVLLTLGTRHNSVPVLKSLHSDSVAYVSATDSIDLSEPRTLWVYSSDGSYRRQYTLWLNADDGATDSAFVWKPATTWPEALLPQTDTLSTQWPYLTAPEATYDLRVVKTATADSALWRRITLADGTGEWTLIPQEKDNPHRLDVAATLALVSTADPQTGAYSAVAVMSNGKLLVSCDQGITWTARDGYALPEGFGSPLRVAQDEGGNVWAENADQRIWQAQRR